MGQILKFKNDSITEAEEYYKTLKLSKGQRKKVDDISKFLNQYLHISERAIKGFFWRVVVDYQIERHMLSSEAEELTPGERVQGLKEIFSLLKKELTRVLISKEQEPLLDDTLNKAIQFYKEQFANR